MPVFLFDIDNTLLYTGGAGGLAMNLAFAEMFGIQDGFAQVEFSGRTDRYILQQGLACHGLGNAEPVLDDFTERYYSLLPRALRERQGYLMPGFPQLLDALASTPGVRLGLATGNFSKAAAVKLEYYGLHGYFSGGGFGEGSLERSVIVRQAIESVGDGASLGEVLVIGDTPHDITAASENGVAGVGVATGSYSTRDLRASGARLVFEDFSDWQASTRALIEASSLRRQ